MRSLFVTILVLLTSAFVPAAGAKETDSITFANQYGLTYLPFMVMQERKLVEKLVVQAGLPEPRVSYLTMGGVAPINDAIVSERAQFGAVGVPSLVQLWSKTKGNLGVKTIGAMTSAPMYLNTNNPSVNSLAQFTDKDKIALPSVKISVQSVTLEMAAAQAFGKDNYKKLDKLTVSMPHPDAMTALLSGSAGVTAHFAGPPFQYQELNGHPEIRRVLSSYDVLGGKSTFVCVVGTETFKKENPKTFGAVVKALAQAQLWIVTNKEAAAELYLRTTKSSEDKKDILAQLNDPDIEFTIVPRNILKYAEFMNEVDPKNIEHKAASWKDLCFENLHEMPGS